MHSNKRTNRLKIIIQTNKLKYKNINKLNYNIKNRLKIHR